MKKAGGKAVKAKPVISAKEEEEALKKQKDYIQFLASKPWMSRLC
jgi:hypothetical protein